MGVIMSKEFHRALDVDGSMKGKAWDFVMKLGREADLLPRRDLAKLRVAPGTSQLSADPGVCGLRDDNQAIRVVAVEHRSLRVLGKSVATRVHDTIGCEFRV